MNTLAEGKKEESNADFEVSNLTNLKHGVLIRMGKTSGDLKRGISVVRFRHSKLSMLK